MPYNGQFCKNRSLKFFWQLITSRQHTFIVLKKYKKLCWIYWKKLLLQARATLFVFISKSPFFTGLVLSSSSQKKLKKWVLSKPQKWRKFKKNDLQTKFTGFYKKDCISFVNNKCKNFTVDNCTHNFKNMSTSASHANFRLDIFHSKTLLYSFWDRKTD